jgi:hypothetical protein
MMIKSINRVNNKFEHKVGDDGYSNRDSRAVFFSPQYISTQAKRTWLGRITK